MSGSGREHDLAIVGAGAAGLATAIFAAREAPGRRIAAFDGAHSLGAKILVSGGGRCNVTNTVVGEADFNGGSRPVIRRVLRALSVEQTRELFRELGVPLHEEPGGKLFPVTNRARTVLDALVSETLGRGVCLRLGHRVTAVTRGDGGFLLQTSQGEYRARRLVLASGGLSLPKTGSDGTGYALARSLGHSIVPTSPALVPLLLEGAFHAALSGVSLQATLAVRAAGAKTWKRSGALLWTHFGVSGPLALDASRHWLRHQLEGRPPTAVAGLVPGRDAAEIDRRLMAGTGERPRTLLRNALGEWLPASVAAAVPAALGIDGGLGLGRLPRDARRRLSQALAEWPLPVVGSRGYNFAEVTAGGVPLQEVDPSTLESRRCPGLHLVGEILDVDGRIGGFNFQWAWSSARVAARAAVW